MTGLSNGLSVGAALSMLLQFLPERILLGLLPCGFPRISKNCPLTSAIIVPVETVYINPLAMSVYQPVRKTDISSTARNIQPQECQGGQVLGRHKETAYLTTLTWVYRT